PGQPARRQAGGAAGGRRAPARHRRARGHPGRRAARPEPARVRPAALPGAARRPGGRAPGPAHQRLADALRRGRQNRPRPYLVAAPQARGNRAATAVPPHRARSRSQAQRPPMRLRIILLVVATSSLVLVSFLIPLALVLRTLAADRAVNSATVQAQLLAPLVATLPTDSLRRTVTWGNEANRTSPVTVVLPDGTQLGAGAPRDAPGRPAATKQR